MPELPEVETVRRGLEPVLTGARFARIEQRRADLRFPFPERFAERLCGRTVERIGRRAKYLLAQIEGGEVLVVHLGMTGRFTIEERSSCSVRDAADRAASSPGQGRTPGVFQRHAGGDPAHDHVVFEMSNGAIVTYNDARRFGYMLLIPNDELDRHPHFEGLGVEPLGNALNATYLAQRAHGRRADLKAFLMDQGTIAGLGNIYVCEALWRAGLSPRRVAASLASKAGAPTERAERLVPAIRSVLEDALAAGGSTLNDYRKTDGGSGYFQHSFAVYDRAGEPCRKPCCSGTVRRLVQGARSTFHCPRCQR